MRVSLRVPALLLAMLLMIPACGSSSEDSTSDAGTGGTTGSDDTSGSDDDILLPNACNETVDCSGADNCIDNVCIPPPQNELTLTDNAVDDYVTIDPNLECKGGAVTAPAEDTPPATIYGIVDRFGSGRETIDIQVSVFLASEWPPEECVDLPFDEQRECFREAPAQAGWSTISTAADAGAPALPDQCIVHKDCPPGYECALIDLERVCIKQYGLYEIAGIPTNTWLVIRNRNDASAPLVEKKWKDTYIQNLYLYSDRVDAEGRYNVNALMVSDGQWKTIPNTLFLPPPGIKPGNGAIGGRLRDCRTEFRDSYTIGWATVDLMDPGSAIGYFNDDEEDTIPLVDRIGTDRFGRFAIVDVPPGQNTVAASALLNGELTSLGSELVYVVPDSLSVVSYPGKQPILKK